MPGIAGIISKSKSGPGNPYQAEHAAMLAAMQHEAFYRTGVYTERNLSLRLGWVVHSSPLRDCLPVANEQRDLILVLHGENFQHPTENEAGQKRSFLQDTQRLLHLYEDMGTSFVSQLNGRVSGVLVDLRQRRVLL